MTRHPEIATLLCVATAVVLSLAPSAVAGDDAAHHAPATTQTIEHHGEDEHAGGGHTDPFSFILIQLALVVVVAMFGRWLAGRCHQPAVLGELLIGVVLGNIGYWLGRPFFVLVMHLGDAGAMFGEVWRTGASVSAAAQNVFSPSQLADGGIGAEIIGIMTGAHGVSLILMAISLWMFSNLGIILLLFMVGLESSVTEMLKVGPRVNANLS